MNSGEEHLKRQLLEFRRILAQPVWKGILLHGASFMVVIGGTQLLLTHKLNPDPVTGLFAIKTFSYGFFAGVVWALIYRWYIKKRAQQLAEKLNISNYG